MRALRPPGSTAAAGARFCYDGVVVVRRLLAASLVLAGATALAACAAIWGFQDAHDVDAGDPDAPIDTEVVPASGADGVVCVPAPPPESQGPLVIDQKSGDPVAAPDDCVAPYGSPLDLFANPKGDPDCGCRCGGPSGLGCTGPTVALFTGAGCA